MTKEDFTDKFRDKEFIIDKEKYTARMFWQLVITRIFEDKKRGTITTFDQAFQSFNPKTIQKI